MVQFADALAGSESSELERALLELFFEHGVAVLSWRRSEIDDVLVSKSDGDDNTSFSRKVQPIDDRTADDMPNSADDVPTRDTDAVNHRPEESTRAVWSKAWRRHANDKITRRPHVDGGWTEPVRIVDRDFGSSSSTAKNTKRRLKHGGHNYIGGHELEPRRPSTEKWEPALRVVAGREFSNDFPSSPTRRPRHADGRVIEFGVRQAETIDSTSLRGDGGEKGMVSGRKG